MKGMRSNEAGLLILMALMCLVLWPVPTLAGLGAALVVGSVVHARVRRRQPPPRPRTVRKPAHRVVMLGPNATAQDRRMYDSAASKQARAEMGIDDQPPFL